jgi:predicted GH43/DUF377 family glycosyl hydrolase
VRQTSPGLARRTGHRLAADSRRVITRLFVPGQEGFDHQDSRASPVVDRILALDDDEVQRSFDDVMARFADRHRDLLGTFEEHAAALAHRLGPDIALSRTRRLLLGATFTSEYSVEGAALCNPSMVAHPDQTDVPADALRFVMSVRAIGEGHRSSIGFRTGVVDADGEVHVDASSPFLTTGTTRSAPLHASVFRGELLRLGTGGENAEDLLHSLGDRFSAVALERQLVQFQDRLPTRHHATRMIALLREIAARTYGVAFAEDTTVPERVLWPATAAESNGMEDARFVRFVEDDATIRYLATYTAYDGDSISQQLLESDDLRSFTSSPVVGAAAANKGLALFPRRVGGRFAALSRADRETNAVAFTDELHRWDTATPCQVPARSWEVLQLGNCGPPIETDDGWLVLTHGVGPMRTYSIGAILLDLEDPTRLIGSLPEPLLSPAADERDGYVPNVVYSCGALVHAGTLVLPYGIGDAAIGIATVALQPLVDALLASPG